MSGDRFAAAQAAFKLGQVAEGISLLKQELEADSAAPNGVYRHLAGALFSQKAYGEAEVWARLGVARFPRDAELQNILGVALRRLGRRDEAIEVLSRTVKLDPKNFAPLSNLGNVFNDLRDARAIEVFSRLVRQRPTEGEWQRQLGRAYWFAGDFDKAEMRLNLAVKLNPKNLDAWIDLQALSAETKGPEEALGIIQRARSAIPNSSKIEEAHISVLRRAGLYREADAHLQALLRESPNDAWIHFQLGGVISDYDRPRANDHLRRAVELDPENMQCRIALAESLGRSRFGDEAANLEEAYQVLRGALDRLQASGSDLEAGPLKVAYEILIRVADYDAIDQLGSFRELGFRWAEAGRHTALMGHLARVKTEQDRLDLMEMHRLWGRNVEKVTSRQPITRRPPRPADGKVRVGFMSSDLRAHPVAYFAMPLLTRYDANKFEVFCYSFYQGEEDPTQKVISKAVSAFRWRQEISDRDAAQMIADDQLDMLIELGGSTHMNKLGVMAYKPAPVQASWVGYPHSAGLSTIDYLVLDPYMTPPNPDLVMERPLKLSSGWYSLNDQAFRPEPAVNDRAPVERNGYVTFGTANNPYKYTRDLIDAWARIVASVPDSRFMFVRPEGATPTFRSNITKLFASHGVAAHRVVFEPVRGRHLPFYNEMDISLDTFPQTGGTTTCESLWMGVPVITLVGEAVFERLSYSVLENVGLGEFCAWNVDEYISKAVALANDPARIGELRRGMRERLRASPLGDGKAFADDYYAAILRAVQAA